MQDETLAATRLAAARRAEGRCEQCGNWPTICGHHLTFAERVKTIQVDKESLRAGTPRRAGR